MTPSLRRAVLAVALGLALLGAPRSEACGGSCDYKYDEPSDEYRRNDVRECLAGHLGDLAQRRYWCRAVGFLLLNGPGLSAEERAFVTQALTDRSVFREELDKPWLVARAKAPWARPLPEPQPARAWAYTDDHTYFPNCLAGGYALAAKTLEERIAQFGVTSVEVANWVDAQDEVFRNCRRVKSALLPAPARPEDPPLIQADRAYQRAAAYFYATEFQTAREHFDAIAQDARSPWRPWARFVAVRTLIREAELKTEDEAVRKALYAKARARTEALLKDPDMKELHPQTRRLLWFIDYRLRPQQHLQFLARKLLERPDEDFAIVFKDYFRLRELRLPAQDELSTFIDSFEAKDGAATARAAWRRTKSVAWLVAALRLSHAGDAGVDAMLAASRAVPESSPAQVMLRLSRGRLLVERGLWEAARAEVLPLLEAGGDAVPREVAEELSTVLMSAARTFEEWAKYAHLSRKGPDFLTHGVPLARYADPALLAALHPRLREQVVLAGWTRAVLTDREDVRRALEPEVERLEPRLAPALARIRERTRPEERRFATVLLLLQAPGLSPFVERPRWGSVLEAGGCLFSGWCERTPMNLYADCGAGGKPCGPRFISPQERAAVRREEAQGVKLGRGPEVLMRAVLDYARKYPQDPLVPEALHHAVRRTDHRHTTYCNNDDPRQHTVRRELSKAAFQLLHRKYGKTEWAQKTPHSF